MFLEETCLYSQGYLLCKHLWKGTLNKISCECLWRCSEICVIHGDFFLKKIYLKSWNMASRLICLTYLRVCIFKGWTRCLNKWACRQSYKVMFILFVGYFSLWANMDGWQWLWTKSLSTARKIGKILSNPMTLYISLRKTEEHKRENPELFNSPK